MNYFEVWSEGYAATRDRAEAKFWGIFKGKTFAEACQDCFKGEEHKEHFDPDNLTYWACRLFNNEDDARKHFG